MKDLFKVFVARPALSLGFLMFSIGMLLTSTSTLANDFENDLVLESWMAVPFDLELQDLEMSLESWMAVPFDNEIHESEISLESWMALPFGNENAEDEVSTEDWMSSSWI